VRRILRLPAPSVGIRLLDRMGALAVILPELTDQHGVAQAKVPGEDLFDHSIRAMDGAAGLPGTTLALVSAAMLHDVGKPATAADGHYIGHSELGAVMAREALQRTRTLLAPSPVYPRAGSEHATREAAALTEAGL